MHTLQQNRKATRSAKTDPSARPHAGRRLVIVSNRIADPRRDEQAGGLAVALTDALRGSNGVWIGWSGRISDGADAPVPKSWRSGGVELVTTDLTRTEHAGYYLGHSNACLWPLFHYRTDLMRFDRAAYEAYRAVNARFAKIVSGLLRPTDIVWIQDYHLIPLAAELRLLGHRQQIGFFHHIPFPPVQVLQTFPEHARLVSDLTAYDVVGLQTEQDALSARAALDASGEATASRPKVAAYPVGIDVDAFTRLAETTAADEIVATMSRSARGTSLIIGVDRLDYTKGLPERLMAYRRLLELHPEMRRRVTFLQIAAKSREDVRSYADLGKKIDQIVGTIEGDYADYDWSPVRYVRRSVARPRVAALYRSCRVGFVTPLRDGMNLVAKEYVAAQNPDDPGVLVLSTFAGASEAMSDAVLVNPYDCDGMARALHRALQMPLDERRARHQALLASLRRDDAAAWRQRFLTDLTVMPARQYHPQLA